MARAMRASSRLPCYLTRMWGHEIDDLASGLLNRLSRHIDHRPAIRLAETQTVLEFLLDVLKVCIRGRWSLRPHVPQALMADQRQALGVGRKPHDLACI